MKKKLSLLLLICILSALNINAEIYNGSCGENVNYSLNTETGLLSITGTGAMADYSNVNDIPWYVRRENIKSVEIADGVTSIGNCAFWNCYRLTSVTIGNSVTSLGRSAFTSCSGLTSIEIPNSVTSIGSYAFQSCWGLTSVTIPNSVTSIESDVFYVCYFEKKDFINNSSLDAEANSYWGATIVDSRDDGFVIKDGTLLKYTGNDASITIPNSVTSIGDRAFLNCSGLTSVTIPNSVTSLGSSAFYGCSGLTSVTIGNSVTSIGSSAFASCSGLTSIEIPNSVTSIGDRAFDGCSGLTSVTIPNSVTSIGYDAFSSTAWYNNQPDGLVYAGLVAYKYKGTMPSNTSITINEGTLGIASSAFSGCYRLTSITIPNSVTSIGYSAFARCEGLTSITIPNSVTSIGKDAFRDCCGLTSVTIPNSVTSIGEGAFWNCYRLTSVTIPNSVTSIGGDAFRECRGLTSVTIPNSVTSIGSYAFSWCSGLTSVSVESGNENYDSRNNCNAIIETASNTLIVGCNNTVIPNSVTSIGVDAFYDCSGLTSVTIPNSVTSIGSYAFDRCSGLTSVISEIKEPFAFGTNAFSSISSSCTLTVPYGTRDAYIAAGWTTDVFKGGIVEIISGSCGDNVNYSLNTETGLLSITGTGAMTDYSKEEDVPWYSNRSSITAVEISDGVTSIGSSAFRSCLGLTSVTIPNSVTSIGNDAFRECRGLTSVTIPNNVTSIGDYAFYNCSAFTSVDMFSNAKSIGASAFSGTPWFDNHPDGLIYVGKVFYKYKGTMPENTSITIDEGTLGIAGDAFLGCSGLISVTIPNSVTSIGNWAFWGCSNITSVTIPNSVITIGNEAFGVCSNLTSIEIPNSVTEIGFQAFIGCSGLTSVHITDVAAWCTIDFRYLSNPLYYAHHLFMDGKEITDLVIPNSVTSIGVDAFMYCSGLTSVTIPNSVTSIGSGAFSGCSGLTSVTIPNSVTSIGNYAFQYCSGLTSVISEIEEPFAFGTNAFNGISSSCTLGVPYGTRDAYIAAGWTTDVFKGGIVEIDPDAMNISIGSAEIGTYCSPYDLDFSGVTGLKAYIMSGFSPSTSTLVLTPVTQVPAGTGLLLKGAEGNYEVPCTTTDMYYTNLLKGVTTATTIDPTDGGYTNFILSNGAHGIGFYTLSESGELAANKAYLQLPTTSVASLSRAMRLVFADDITGIDEKKAETKKEDNIFYDLQGRRVDNPTQGLYIVNGKKVFINK